MLQVWPCCNHGDFKRSFDIEVLVWNEEAFNSRFCDADHADDTTRGAVSEAGQRNRTLNELFSFVKRHVWMPICIFVTIDEGTARTRDAHFLLLEESSLIHTVDLVAFVWVPTRADHACAETTGIAVDDFAHDRGCRLDGWKTLEILCLHIDVVSHILSNCLGV